MHQCLKFILERHSTCFGRSFRPSSGVQDCTYSDRHMSNRYCWLHASMLSCSQQCLFDICLSPYVQSWTPDDGQKDLAVRQIESPDCYWLSDKSCLLIVTGCQTNRVCWLLLAVRQIECADCYWLSDKSNLLIVVGCQTNRVCWFLLAVRQIVSADCYWLSDKSFLPVVTGCQTNRCCGCYWL